MSTLSLSQVAFSKVYFINLLLHSVADITVSEAQSRPKSQHRSVKEVVNTKVLGKEYPISLKNKYFRQVKLKLYLVDIKRAESLYENIETNELINHWRELFFHFNILDFEKFLNFHVSESLQTNDAIIAIQARFASYLKSVNINSTAYQNLLPQEYGFIESIDSLMKDPDNVINLTIQKDNKFCQKALQYVLCLFPIEFLYCKLNNVIQKFQISKNSEIHQIYNAKDKENLLLESVYSKGVLLNEDTTNLYNKDCTYNKKVMEENVTNIDYDETYQNSINYQVDTTANSVSTNKSLCGNNIADTILVNNDFYEMKSAKNTLLDKAIEVLEYEEKIDLIKEIMVILSQFKKFDNIFADIIFKQKIDMFLNSFFKFFHATYSDFLRILLVQKTAKNLSIIHKSYTQYKIFLMNISFEFDKRWEYIFETLNIKEFEDFFQKNFTDYFNDQKFKVAVFINDIEQVYKAFDTLDPRYDFIKINFNTIFKAYFSRNFKNMIRKFKKRARVKEFEVFKIFQNFILQNINRFNLNANFDEDKIFNSHFIKFYKNFVLYLSDKFYIAVKEVYQKKEIDEEFMSIKIFDVLKLGRVLGNELQYLFITRSSMVYTNAMVHFTRNISRDILDLLSDMRNDFVKEIISIHVGKKSTNIYQKLFRILKDTCNIIMFINEYKSIMENKRKRGTELTINKMHYYELESILESEDIQNYKVQIGEKILYSNETLFMHTYESEEDLQVQIFHKEKLLYKIQINDVSKDGRVQIELKKRKILLNLKFRLVVVEDFSIDYYADMVVKNGSLLCKYINKEIIKQEFDNLGNKDLVQKLKDTGVINTVKGLESDYFYNVLWRHYCESVYFSQESNYDKMQRINQLYEILELSLDNKNVLDKENVYYEYIVNIVELTKSAKKSEVIIYYEKDNLMLPGEIKVKTETIEDAMRKLKKRTI